MDGIHDLGGMHGFGPVVSEENMHEQHAEWHSRTRALLRVARSHGVINIDEFRHRIERLRPVDYLTSGYYERWLKSIECLLVEKGVVTQDEVAERMTLLRERPGAVLATSRQPVAADVARPAARVPTTPPLKTEPGFREGEAVLARNIHPVGHTRLPRYVRGKRGTIHQFQGIHVFPDAHAHGQGEQAQPMYTVRFEADELWSTSAEPREAVYVDLWESYLEADTHA